MSTLKATTDPRLTTQDAVYLAHLIDCALHDRTPKPLQAQAAWERVWALACANSVEALAGMALLKAADAPQRLRDAAGDQINMTLYRRLQFDAEREAIFADLAAQGLSYLPLKGALLAGYYPAPQMRSMADNDFLYGYVEPITQGIAASGPLGSGGYRIAGATERERERTVERGIAAMVRVMERRGYRTVSSHAANHETFEKPPVFTFEPHRRLVSPRSSMAAYYQNPWSRAIQDAHDPHLFHFGASDEYVYLLAHAYKHFDQAGCGVRYVVDIRVFLDAKGDELDRAYVDGQLAQLGLTQFERASRELADAAFTGASTADGSNLDAEQAGLLAHLVGSGTYGSAEQLAHNRFAKELDARGGDVRAARASYLWTRMTDRESIENTFPRASRIRALYPLLAIARLAIKGVTSWSKWTAEIRQLRKL